jgi:hypothetical protein
MRLWFRVENIDATYTRLLKLGVRGEMPPNRDEKLGEVLASLRDPH